LGGPPKFWGVRKKTPLSPTIGEDSHEKLGNCVKKENAQIGIGTHQEKIFRDAKNPRIIKVENLGKIG